MTRAVVAGAALLALGATGCGGAKTTTVTITVTRTRTVTATDARPSAPPTSGPTSMAGACSGGSLGGIFTLVAGSAGAGQITYRLRLTNTGSTPCFVSGLPAVQLLDRNGSALPTHASAARPGTQTAVRVELAPRASTTAQARFSPDVPGTGEPQSGRCEPVAITLRVEAPGGGTVDVPIKPVTSVCEHGSMQLSTFSSAG